jgi:hypothetical protein
MSLYDEIVAVYPELEITADYDEFKRGAITLQDDGDGIAYVAKWEYSKPLPSGMKLGK